MSSNLGHDQYLTEYSMRYIGYNYRQTVNCLSVILPLHIRIQWLFKVIHRHTRINSCIGPCGNNIKWHICRIGWQIHNGTYWTLNLALHSTNPTNPTTKYRCELSQPILHIYPLNFTTVLHASWYLLCREFVGDTCCRRTSSYAHCYEFLSRQPGIFRSMRRDILHSTELVNVHITVLDSGKSKSAILVFRWAHSNMPVCW